MCRGSLVDESARRAIRDTLRGMAFWLAGLIAIAGPEAAVPAIIATVVAAKLFFSAIRGHWRWAWSSWPMELADHFIGGLRKLFPTTAGPGGESNESAASSRGLRSDVLSLLGLLSDLGAQRQYERDVPTAAAPTELVCMWFDDLYYPGTALFEEAFTEAELGRLARFHGFFQVRLGALGYSGIHARETPARVEELHAIPEWQEIVEEASLTLASFDTP